MASQVVEVVKGPSEADMIYSQYRGSNVIFTSDSGEDFVARIYGAMRQESKDHWKIIGRIITIGQDWPHFDGRYNLSTTQGRLEITEGNPAKRGNEYSIGLGMDLYRVQPEDVIVEILTSVRRPGTLNTFDVIERTEFGNQSFMADILRAIRNHKSPADAIALLADHGQYSIDTRSPAYNNRIGTPEPNERK